MSFLFVILMPLRSFAFLDFIGEQAKEVAEAAAYVDAASDLVQEISPSPELKEESKSLQQRAEKLRSDARSIRYLSKSTTRILSGPDWSSRRLETNIRSTTDYIRRLKRIIAQISALGLKGTTALNVTETNVALNEIQKNQQTMILQNENAKLREIEKEQEIASQWDEFSQKQRSLRNAKN